MRNFESSAYEIDPSYDPETLDGASLNEAGSIHNETMLESTSKISTIHCPAYYSRPDNPYQFDTGDPSLLHTIADAIDTELLRRFRGKDVLVRGVQSANFDISQSHLANYIAVHGGDYTLKPDRDTAYDFHAAHHPGFQGGCSLPILEGFHVYKPKCNELPLKPLDIWMVFDAGSYEEISYIHPRHDIVARDRYKLRQDFNANDSLLGIICITP